MKNLRTFSKLWSQWYVCQTGLVVSHLMKSPTVAEWPMSTLAQPFHTLCHTIPHYSTLCHTSVPLPANVSTVRPRCPHYPHCIVPATLFRRGGYGGADLDHHTYPFCKIISRVYDHAPKCQGVDAPVQNIHIPFTLKTYSALPRGTRAGTVVSELVTLTKHLSKLSFAGTFMFVYPAIQFQLWHKPNWWSWCLNTQGGSIYSGR